MTVSVWVSFAAPAPMPLKFTVWADAFSLMLTLLNPFSVGASFTALTVTVNVRVTVLFAACPSLTVTVIVAQPLAFATGVKFKLPVALGLA